MDLLRTPPARRTGKQADVRRWRPIVHHHRSHS
jgi:hypothetical protein